MTRFLEFPDHFLFFLGTTFTVMSPSSLVTLLDLLKQEEDCLEATLKITFLLVMKRSSVQRGKLALEIKFVNMDVACVIVSLLLFAPWAIAVKIVFLLKC